MQHSVLHARELWLSHHIWKHALRWTNPEDYCNIFATGLNSCCKPLEIFTGAGICRLFASFRWPYHSSIHGCLVCIFKFMNSISNYGPTNAQIVMNAWSKLSDSIRVPILVKIDSPLLHDHSALANNSFFLRILPNYRLICL